MKKILLSGLILSTCTSLSYSQNIFTYGNNPVSSSEFIKVYQKNNATQNLSYSDKALRDYIDLYSLFKMKVTEANAMHLDTSESVAREIDSYRKQLAKSYLTDEELSAKLISEAYERSKNDLRVAHILLLIKPQSDTVLLKKRIDSIYTQIIKGKADFAAMAKTFSEDKGSAENGGDLGYFSALQTVYAFENMAYNTPVGKVSQPFKTSFGYHILKVLDKRPSRGQVHVAQIMIATPKATGLEGEERAKRIADTVQRALKAGASFDSLVLKYSDDRFSKDKHGELEPFGVGKMVPAFENAAFALNKPGEISKTVKTDYGFHIIKLIEKIPIKPFDQVKKEIKVKVENDSRGQNARDLYFERIKSNNGFKEYPENWKSLVKLLNQIEDTGAKAGVFTPEMFSTGGSNKLFSLAGHDFTQNDFLNFAGNTTRGKVMVKGDKEPIFRQMFQIYQSNIVQDFQEHQLIDKNPEFKNLMQEYKDGIMLFDLMDKKVWGRASQDSVGLKAYYDAHKSNYMWEPGFEGQVYTFKNQETLNKAEKLFAKKNTNTESILKTINTEEQPDAVQVSQGTYEFSKFSEMPASKIVEGKYSSAQKVKDKFVVVFASKVWNKSIQKDFKDARGYVVSAYQDQLEKDWNASLRTKYPVTINEAELKKLVK